MTRFADELVGSEGEWGTTKDERRFIIRAVHDCGQRAPVQFEDDESTAILWVTDIELEGNEDDVRPGRTNDAFDDKGCIVSRPEDFA